MNYLYLVSILISSFLIFSSVFWMFVFLEESNMNNKKHKNRKKSVAIVIPCIYEGKEIINTVEKALEINYKNKRIYLVLNKSSSKETVDSANYLKNKYNEINLIFAPFNGKSKVLNYSIKNFVKEEIILILDADTYVERNMLNIVIPYFDNKEVGAVVSSVKVDNYRDSLIAWAQKYEYDLSILARNASSKINSLIIAHGAGSAFRKDILEKINYFDENNITEDLEIGLRLNLKGYYVINDLKAISYTKVPTSLYGLFRQRRRWYTGFFINLFKYKNELNKNKDLKYVFLPFSIISSSISLFSSLLIFINIPQLINFINFVISNKQIFSFIITTEVLNYLSASFFSNVLVTISIILGFTSLIFMLYKANNGFNLENVFGLLFYVFIYNFIISFIWFYSLLFVLIKRKQSSW
ncbi:MAG: glycosyltransferase [Candidatus Rehaiarchaeum fermentans]|nr:glycosyltransferase family 2 protein [Candidatus Rehaiarchaeum fermentans]MCW1297190.1 glycosyltransferase family 2 protein [Candidatus Rehaiarchaeum fermentans]MCW1302085.1 glycosyltransferase family 2 protein [Candidatus Rehaiarchaeum fermentans]